MNNQISRPLESTVDRCEASSELEVGFSEGAFFSSVDAFEAYDSGRSSRFPNTCTLEGITGSPLVSFNIRYSTPRFPSLYNVATRRRGEIFAYGGVVSQDLGAYVAKLNAETFEEMWRTHIHIPGHWNYPGVGAVLGDGHVYAVAGNRLARVDADTGEQVQIELPQRPEEGGAAYNGFVVSPDRVIFAKGMEHGIPCDQTSVQYNGGLGCAVYHNIPSFLVAIDTKTRAGEEPRIIAQTQTEEFILGRLTTERRNGVDYIYCPGTSKLWRYKFFREHGRCLIELDREWQIPYVGGGTPGTAVALMNDWAVIVNNGFETFMQPFTIWAANIHDSHNLHKLQPLQGYPVSQVGSKPAVDPENRRVFVSDFHAGFALGLDFDPAEGFRVRWQQQQSMMSFWDVTGPPDQRQVVGTDYVSSGSDEGDHAVWRDASTGREVARTPTLNSIYNAMSINPAFDGKFYYVEMNGNRIVEISPAPAR